MPVLRENEMGRVYDALKRANTLEPRPAQSRCLPDSSLRGEVRLHRTVPATAPVEEQLFNVSSIAGRRQTAVKSSAFTAHTANASDGMALPDGTASGAVGATLNAARPARVTGLVSYDIDPTRVEPHLVAITQPRSAYCEQFRSLRTRVLQAGERQQMHTFVITSAGIVMAAVFCVLAVLPLIVLTQLGVIVGLGILLDTFVVRTVLIPALFTVIGPRIWWPAKVDHTSW